MNDAALLAETGVIAVDAVFPHAPPVLWTALTTPALMGRWLMAPTGFAPVVGTCFTYQTTPAGAWDGVIRCEVLEAVPNRLLSYSWRSGDAGNVGYGAPLDTLVVLTLTEVAGGTRLSLVHSGFRTPQNDGALCKMREGWPKVLGRVGVIAGEVA